jgi:8-oxo-dGTP pyrophosphatase MutT (NUDIX family)
MSGPVSIEARLVEAARRFAASGAAPVTPRPSATVLLLRDPYEVYLIERAASMAFAAGMYAFPGGAAEPGDADPRATAVREVEEETGVVLSPGALVPWARWITPEWEPRRYDTYFFLARLPVGQSTRRLGREATHDLWLPPADAADLPMLPPTRMNLADLARYESIEAAFAAERDQTPVQPQVENGRMTYPKRPVM